MTQKVAVVIPTYKDELDDLEKISLTQCRKVLGNYPLIFLAPEGKIFSYFKPGDMIAHFPPQYFQSLQTYSNLLMSPFFYEAFKDFEYILLYQLDAFVFYDALEYFCSLGYDYIGAPWPYFGIHAHFPLPKTPRVGNGGFCLRKVQACRRVLTEFRSSSIFSKEVRLSNVGEDAFFSVCGIADDINFHVAPFDIASTFSMDYLPLRFIKKFNNCLPFGCHDWNKFSAEVYIEIFSQLGYDLRPYRNQMGNRDFYIIMTCLENLALKRLARRIERRQSILRYLPTNHFASVCVVRSADAMKILSSLILEENFFADKIFIYNPDEQEKIIQDLKRETLPHLLLITDSDKNLINALKERGLSYGDYIISFCREYMNCCQELFRKLGK